MQTCIGKITGIAMTDQLTFFSELLCNWDGGRRVMRSTYSCMIHQQRCIILLN